MLSQANILGDTEHWVALTGWHSTGPPKVSRPSFGNIRASHTYNSKTLKC